MQFCSIWTDVDVAQSFVVEISLTKEFASLLKIGKRHIRTNVLLFEGRNDFGCSVGGISGKLPWPEFPTEASSPEQIQDRLILHHLGRSDKNFEDNPCFPSIHDVMGMVAQLGPTGFAIHHRRI